MNIREEIEHDWLSFVRPEFEETYKAVEAWLKEQEHDMFFLYTLLYDIGYARGKRAERRRKRG